MSLEWSIYDLANEYLRRARKLLEAGYRAGVDYWTLRKAQSMLLLGVDGLAQELEKLARRFGGCINCVYSRPCEQNLDLTCRVCVLGLSQDKCDKRKPLV